MLLRSGVALVAALVTAVGAPATVQAVDPRPPVGAVAVIGDFGSGGVDERRVADLVARAAPTAIVSTGDNVYDSDDYDALVGRHYGAWVERGSFLPAAGNHDHSEGIAAFDAYFDDLQGRRTYTRVVGDIQFFVLDSQAALDSPQERRRQYTWLRTTMRRSASPWQVVVLHHPPYSSGAVHGSTDELRWPFGWWGADLVLSGHEHHYERLTVRGTTYVVDGAGGKDLYPFGRALPGSAVRFDRDVGSLFLVPRAGRLVGEFWSAGGERVDRFSVPGPR